MIGIGDPDGEHPHDAYQRFLRAGTWTTARLWCQLVRLLLAHLELGERLVLDLDDTLSRSVGARSTAPGSFRDPIRSRGQHTVFAHGLNLIVLTLRVRPPWGGELVCRQAPAVVRRRVRGHTPCAVGAADIRRFRFALAVREIPRRTHPRVGRGGVASSSGWLTPPVAPSRKVRKSTNSRLGPREQLHRHQARAETYSKGIAGRCRDQPGIETPSRSG
jgi:hypothetical protein